MGSMEAGASRLMSSSIPARTLRALSSIAEEQPNRAEVLPVTMRPSGSSIAEAGSPVASATSSAGGTTGRSSLLTPTLAMSSAIRWDWTGAMTSRFSVTRAR